MRTFAGFDMHQVSLSARSEFTERQYQLGKFSMPLTGVAFGAHWWLVIGYSHPVVTFCRILSRSALCALV